MPFKVLVTGGAGFVGSFLVDRLVEEGHQVAIYDDLDPQVHPNGKAPVHMNPQAQFIQGDIRDYEPLKKACEKADWIVHFAAAVGVGQSQYQIKHYVNVNVGGTANLLDILANHPHRVRKLLVAGSMSAYGEGTYECTSCGRTLDRHVSRSPEDLGRGIWKPRCPACKGRLKALPTDETKLLESSSIYALTKRMQEEMVLQIGMTCKIPSCALRFFNIYGPRQSLSNPYTGVVAIFMSRIKNGHRPVVFEDGKQSRDFVSVHDIVNACLLALKSERAAGKVYNVGTGRPTTVLQIAHELAKIYGHTDIAPDIQNKFRSGDIRHCASDITKIREELGFEPTVTLEAGLKELVEWAETAEAKDSFDQMQAEMAQKGLV